MGCSQCNFTNPSFENPQSIITLPAPLRSLSKVSNFDMEDHDHHDNCDDDKDNNNELRFKSLSMKMVWDFGFGCFVVEKERNNNNNSKNDRTEENKAWLLAESGGDLANREPLSVHSSFRFSICSQKELDSMKTKTPFAPSSSSTTVMMVKLDSNSSSNDLQWRKIASLEKNISPIASSLIRFSYDEILYATRNFSQGRVLGRGACSYVFRGKLGFLRTAVAIKRLDKEDEESPKAFCRELTIASSLEHPNIVPLLGFCIDQQQGLFLVYKYVSSGSLERHLHGKKKKKKTVKSFASLSLSVRYKIAVGIAEAIDYLHNGSEKCIVHRDIKPSNILLSSKKRPKLCDFGLATWTPAPSVPFLCKTVKGTFGYLAPEYFQHGKISDKTDVYAFGVVLLELITGRTPIDTTKTQGEENLVLWAKPLLDQGGANIDTLLDPRAKVTRKGSKLIARMVRTAAACLNNEESCRPGINEAVTLLRGENCVVKGKKGLVRNISALQIPQRSKSEMNKHLALAMLGVSELDEDDFLYGR